MQSITGCRKIAQACRAVGNPDITIPAVTGGLRPWWDANFEMDSVNHYAGGLRTGG